MDMIHCVMGGWLDSLLFYITIQVVPTSLNIIFWFHISSIITCQLKTAMYLVGEEASHKNALKKDWIKW
jgi:uncharacterized membrane protein YedE/YeeE